MNNTKETNGPAVAPVDDGTKSDTDANVGQQCVVRHYYSTDDERYQYSTAEEAGEQFHGTDEPFTVYCGMAVDVVISDLAPGLKWIAEHMEEQHYEMFDDAPDYTALNVDDEKVFEQELHDLLKKYWNKPTWSKINQLWEKTMQWDGDALVDVSDIAA